MMADWIYHSVVVKVDQRVEHVMIAFSNKGGTESVLSLEFDPVWIHSLFEFKF